MMPGSGKSKTAYEKLKDRARYRRRAAIEPIIGNLKSDYRILRNNLKEVEGNMINTIVAATAFNMMKKLWKIQDAIYLVLNQFIQYRLVKHTKLTIYSNPRLPKAPHNITVSLSITSIKYESLRHLLYPYKFQVTFS